MDILLSVIVPIYNVKGYVEKCIESICNQTYQNLEIILVDDGSTDGSGEICDNFAEIDKRIKVVHKINGGLISARKAGAKVATGEYVINVDGDDWIDKDRFKNLVEKALKIKPSMAYMSGHYKEYEKESVLIKSEYIEGIYNKEQIRTDLMKLLAGNGMFLERKMEFGQWLWCVSREIYEKNQLKINENIKRAEDFVAMFSCILDSEKIVCIEEPSYHYIQRKGSINNKKPNWTEEHAKIYFKQINDILNRHKMNSEILNVATQYAFHNIFLTNYKILYNYYKEYLFPYFPVKRGSRIIVYGAGNIGVEIVNAIDENPRYEIVAWVDKKRKENHRSQHNIEEIAVVHKRKFDYIVIAVLVADVSRTIKKELSLQGIPEEKIVLMQSYLMKFDDLDNMMRY